MKDTCKTYLQPAFLICAAILAISAAGMSAAVKSFGMYLEKKPFPLKKSLDLLDQAGLGPYKVTSKRKIDNKDVLKSLGTEDYIEWTIEDSEVSKDSPIRQCMLFITYYSIPDRVPHVPEECYTGSGYQRLSSEVLPIKFEDANEKNPAESSSHKDVLVKYLVFEATSSEKWWSSSKFPVLYVFSVNGQYTNSREETRLVLNKNIFNKHSYFSKVEWKFFNTRFNQYIYPTREEATAASSKLLKVVLTLLEKEHWPQI